MKSKTVYLTRDRSFYRSLVSLAISVALQNLITFAVTFADNLMVGSLGDSAIFVLLVVLPFAILAARLGAPAWVVFACLKCDQILKCIVAYFKINSFNWMKNLTRNKA